MMTIDGIQKNKRMNGPPEKRKKKVRKPSHERASVRAHTYTHRPLFNPDVKVQANVTEAEHS